MELRDLLSRASSGGGVLFCGAGFSSDSLTLSGADELGAGDALLNLLNEKLRNDIPVPYRELKNAADKFAELQGEHKLLALLQDRSKVARITDDMTEVVRFPWDRIYTTNYDNALQLACTRADKNFHTLNNLDTLEDIPDNTLAIVHLHGSAEKWDIHNFRRSCVLGADSYYDAERTLGPWLGKLQDDFDRSRLFVFIGFRANDFHLNRVFFAAREARPKVFFVNRSSVSLDPDLQMTQEKFGRPLSIGRSGLSKLVRDVMQSGGTPSEPHAPSYRRYERPPQALEVPSVESIRDLFILGKLDRSQLVRDVSLGKSDYHVPRAVTSAIIREVDGGGTVTLITGEICDGKSIIVEELCARLSRSRPIYVMHRPYETIAEETRDLISAHSNPVFLIENCFDLSSSRLDALLHFVNGTNAALILTSRSISAAAEVSDFQKLKTFESSRRFLLPRLDDDEVQKLVRTSDQIGGWLERPMTSREKIRFVQEDCRRSLPAFLLKLLQSKFVRDRYVEEYNKTADLCSHDEIRAVVGALYIAHIGHDAPLSFMSRVFRMDIETILTGLEKNANHGLHLVRAEGGRVRTVPSIGASSILREIVPSRNRRLVVDTVVEMLRSLATREYGDDFAHHIFTQLMRYSILASVVKDVEEINRFFDNVSKIDYCRTQVLFWLQWHMAMLDQRRFTDAETYLKRSYVEADAYEKRSGNHYDRIQIDDRKAKFLVIRIRSAGFSNNMFRDLKDACQITERLIRRNDLTHHPFDTFVEIVESFDQMGPKFPEPIRMSILQLIRRLGDLVQQRAALLNEGYQARRAKRAMERFTVFMRRLEGTDPIGVDAHVMAERHQWDDQEC